MIYILYILCILFNFYVCLFCTPMNPVPSCLLLQVCETCTAIQIR